jgi:ketosteroid isomerase-like protein
MLRQGESGGRLGWAAIGLLCFFASACSGLPTVKPRADAERAQVERLVRGWLLAWENGDRELLRSTLHPQILFAYPAIRTDYAGTLASFDEFHRDFTGTRVYVHQIQVDGNRFTAEYQFATTRKSSGRRQATGTIAIGEVQDGRLRLVKEYVDGRVSRMQEAGELPLDEGEEPFPWPRKPATP